MSELNDFQLKLLSDAAQRKDGLVVTAGELTAAAGRRIDKLLSAGFVTEVPAKRGAGFWREADGARLALHITSAGLAAIVADEDELPPPVPSAPTEAELAARGFVRRPTRPGAGYIIAAPVASPNASASPAGKGRADLGGEASGSATRKAGAAHASESKQARVIALLRRQQGATIAELITATGWQAHSVRGFLSGTVKKKRGLPVVSEKSAKDGERRYRISGATANDASSR